MVWILNIEDCADGERHDSGKGHHVKPVVVPRFDDEASNECAQAAQEKKKKKHSVGGCMLNALRRVLVISSILLSAGRTGVAELGFG